MGLSWPTLQQTATVRQGLATQAAALDEVEAADAARMPVDGGVFIEHVTFEVRWWAPAATACGSGAAPWDGKWSFGLG